MSMPSSPREDSVAVVIPTAIPTPAPGGHPSRKRKHAAMSHVAASSPAPSDPGATPGPDNLVVPTRHRDLAARPRLTISRHPLFVPVSPGSLYYTTEPLCNNRLNFRYIPAGIAPPESILPFRTIESAPTTFRVSWEDRSPFVKVTQDGLGLKGEKGFRSARCNAPVREGKWYMEIKVELGGEKAPDSKRREGSHVRLGWARREAPLNGPAGLDGYSYALRDKTGEKIHLSRLRPYGRPFVSGDVVGMYISLPSPRRKPDKKDPCDPRTSNEYYESLEYTQSKEMIALMDASDRAKATNSSSLPSSSTKKSATVKNLPSTSRGAKRGERETAPMRPLPTLGADSRIAFFVNGECQGIAFQDLYDYLPLRVTPDKSQKKKTNKEGLREHRENPFDDGTLGYYPFISLFNEARVRLNPGPDFDFPPPPDIDAVLSNSSDMDIKPPASKRTWRPMCERYPEFIAEQKAMDELEEAEARKVQKVVDPDQEKAEADKVEQHRAKRRAQAAARRERKIAQKAKEEEEAREKRRKLDEEQIALGREEEVPMQVDDDRFGAPISMSVPDTPTLTDLAVMDGDTDRAPSPAPSTSTVDITMPGFTDTSGYNTEIEDGDGEVVLEMDNTEGETGIVRTDPEAFDIVPVTDSLPCAGE
ncbi:Set1 complex component ash2 [Grifola frondosa]|uniref:Set1 complex component ash2 n=1 Tax=Grifola frondosa TaxID=5627 RepID=A0A1C7MGC4_GRIFR|nr:Set1 complex component ash2 [Grifola frondosa]